MRDKKNFADPEEFRPERFIRAADGKFQADPKVTFFGFGHRRCPGEALARIEVWD